MRWETVSTPNSQPNKNDVLNPLFSDNRSGGSEIRDLVVGNDSKTLVAAVTVDNWTSGINIPGAVISPDNVPGHGALGIIMASNTGGISWTQSPYLHLVNSTGWTMGNHVYNVRIAPDNPRLWVVSAGSITAGPVELWASSDSGASWSNTNVPVLAPNEAICAIDISIDYGTGRDIAVGTRSGTGAGRLFITRGAGFGSWRQQVVPRSNVDFFAIKFSPTYNGDNAIAMVYAGDNQTIYNIGIRDINNNSILTWALSDNGVEVRSGSASENISPSFSTLAVACLALPSDFNGQSSSLRRAFVSLYSPYDDTTNNATGVYRIDDTSSTALYPTSTTPKLQAYSIAFFGTYSTGKLLAGLVWGSPCLAVVPTLFADTPCTCAGSCLYRSLKPPTGAANQGICLSENLTGVGSAIVAYSPDGSLGYAATGSGLISDNTTWWNSTRIADPYDLLSRPHPWVSTLIPNDESALSITRNNGDTWNQLSLIDTTIDWFNDVAVAADCTTLYLASVHRNAGFGFAGVCNEFDSVWRYTYSPAIAAPLPALAPVGAYWERVLCRTTSYSCFYPQTDLPLLRTVTSCTDSQDGGVVGWAAQYGATVSGNVTISGGIMAWSPDYGDYWVSITPRNVIQDFAFESSKVIYTVSPLGMVQRLPYTGTAWSTSLPSSSTDMTAHTITARNGKVLVGASSFSNDYGVSAAYSSDSGKNWYTYRNSMPSGGNVHVIFDVDWEKNYFIYAATDNSTGTVYRNTAPAFTRWDGNDMMDPSNGATGPDWWSDNVTPGDPPHRVGYYGIVMAFTGDPQPALYAAHDNITVSVSPVHGDSGPHGVPGEMIKDSGVCRTLEPRNGVPKPGVYWDCLDIYMPPNQTGVNFTLEPTSLRACGCCSLNSNTMLWAIDNESGLAIDLSGISTTDNITTLIGALTLRGRYEKDPGYRPELNQGMLWSYTDCLAKKPPVLRTPPDQALVGADPVTGRNQQIDLSWEQLCLSSVYQLQIAKDKAFTLRINPQVNNADNIQAVTGSLFVNTDAVNVTSPAIWLSPGALPEAGAFYFWRVRTYKSATRQIAVSPWSEVRSFRVKPGFVVNSPYYGVQLLSPDNGCWACKVKPASFSWSPWKEATRYEFVLARDSELTQVVKKAATSTTGYEYDGTLDYSTNYFWRVRAVEINGKPVSSDWSATFSFKTEAATAPEKPAAGEPATPLWVWAVIGVGSILVIVTLILLIRTRS
jgi:hypothetical protein